MASERNRNAVLTYQGGTFRATKGLIEYMFGARAWSWTPSAIAPPGPGGRRRRKYGARQRSLAAAGTEVKIVLDTGDTWTGRVTGAIQDFIDELLTKTTPGKVKNVYTRRGTIYGPQYN